MGKFSHWLIKEGLFKDVYGFDKQIEIKRKDPKSENPVNPIDADTITDTLVKLELNGKSAFSEFSSQVQWGTTTGAVQMIISPFGSFKSIIRKLHEDLEGNKVWICKKVVPYKEFLITSHKFDEKFALDLFDRIEKIDRTLMETPSHDYEELERLTHRLASYCRTHPICPELFLYQGIRKINIDNYLIHFECRGHGVEAPGSARVEEFIIDISYNNKTGMIRSFGCDVQSPIKGHKWTLTTPEWDEYFSPSQDVDEIIEAIGAAFSTY